MHHATDRIAHTTTFVMSVVEHWLEREIAQVRKETRCRHICYSFRLAARVLLYAPSHRQDSTYHGLCYTSREALAGMRNSSIQYSGIFILRTLFLFVWLLLYVFVFVRGVVLLLFLTHCGHMAYSFRLGRKEGNVLFNDARNTLSD